jgi:hypothetical protein
MTEHTQTKALFGVEHPAQIVADRAQTLKNLDLDGSPDFKFFG